MNYSKHKNVRYQMARETIPRRFEFVFYKGSMMKYPSFILCKNKHPLDPHGSIYLRTVRRQIASNIDHHGFWLVLAWLWSDIDPKATLGHIGITLGKIWANIVFWVSFVFVCWVSGVQIWHYGGILQRSLQGNLRLVGIIHVSWSVW